ncbi:MAG: hypothetical protein HPY53_01600 [Brevinematales bacterium]|nr:hypothetical protein [Brevinematales bacterium]
MQENLRLVGMNVSTTYSERSGEGGFPAFTFISLRFYIKSTGKCARMTIAGNDHGFQVNRAFKEADKETRKVILEKIEQIFRDNLLDTFPLDF